MEPNLHDEDLIRFALFFMVTAELNRSNLNPKRACMQDMSRGTQDVAVRQKTQISLGISSV